MRIAVTAGYWAAGPPPGVAELFVAADRAGVDQIWTAEAYGSDAWTPLAWWGSRTSRIQLGTAVSQLSARPPVTLGVLREPDAEFDRTWALGAAAIDGDTAITAGARSPPRRPRKLPPRAAQPVAT